MPDLLRALCTSRSHCTVLLPLQSIVPTHHIARSWSKSASFTTARRCRYHRRHQMFVCALSPHHERLGCMALHCARLHSKSLLFHIVWSPLYRSLVAAHGRVVPRTASLTVVALPVRLLRSRCSMPFLAPLIRAAYTLPWRQCSSG
jgi:hypothetical protein